MLLTLREGEVLFHTYERRCGAAPTIREGEMLLITIREGEALAASYLV